MLNDNDLFSLLFFSLSLLFFSLSTLLLSLSSSSLSLLFFSLSLSLNTLYLPLSFQATADGWAHEASTATTRDDVDAADGFPLREIATAVLLLIGGTVCLVFARQAATGRLPSAAPGAAWGLLTVGLLAFLPGFYVSRIAYYAWRRREGYSFADIPRG